MTADAIARSGVDSVPALHRWPGPALAGEAHDALRPRDRDRVVERSLPVAVIRR